jgi:hypothetical protein
MDHVNYRKIDRWLLYRFYRALQRLKSPMRYICEILGARQFLSVSDGFQDEVSEYRHLVSSLGRDLRRTNDARVLFSFLLDEPSELSW